MKRHSTHMPAWYCVRTQTKREHLAANYLRELEKVEVFCPRLRYRKATRRGKIWWVEPLFPGYVLAKFIFTEMERAVAFCQGVRGLVRFGAVTPPIPDAFVEALRADIQSSRETEEDLLTIHPSIEPGDEVEVAHGPLQGIKGKIIEVAPAVERVKILLEFLGQEQAVELDIFSLLLQRRPQPWRARLSATE